MRLKKLHNDDNGILWVSAKPMMDSDWPVYFFLRVKYASYLCDEPDFTKAGEYLVEIHAVAPQAVSAETMQRAQKSCGWGGMPDTDEARAELLLSYGVSARLYATQGHNLRKALRAARRELNVIAGLMFGFRMDARQNAIGNDGWDFISGNIGFKHA